MTKLVEGEFPLFAALVRDSTGIVLDSSKAYLVETRLTPLVMRTGSRSFGELYRCIGADSSGELKRRMVDLITTQETSFFRDSAPFEMLKYKILPDLVDARSASVASRPRLRIWSAACATGQELYSIAMALAESLGDLARYDLRLLGTDISDAAIAKASIGRYSEAELSRGLSDERRERFFRREADGAYRVRDELRAFVGFKRLNLHEDFSCLGSWDVIFCRNIAIYFAEAAKRSLFDRLGRVLAPDGSLVLGSTESLFGLCPQYEARRYLRSVYYGLREEGRAALQGESH